MNIRPDTDDATLVAWIDGELPQREADAVAAKVASDAALHDRAALLRAARSELRWALDESPTAPPPAAARRRARVARSPRTLGWLVAAAALAVVAWTFFETRGVERKDSARAARNDLLAVHLSTTRSGWDLFTDMQFALTGEALTDARICCLQRRADETDAELAQRALGGESGVPVAIDAELITPTRTLRGSIAQDFLFPRRRKMPNGFALTDVRVDDGTLGPYCAVRFERDGASEDFRWAFQKGIEPVQGERGVVIEDVGEYRLTLRLRALPPAPGQPPAFGEPLEVAIGFAVRGVVGDWSEPVDGMRARIVASRAEQTDGRPLAIAVQLRNDSDRARRYNVVGTTIAEIPQPFHFDLLHDGRQCEQRDDLGVVIRSAWSGELHAPGTIRSVIVLDDYWRVDGKPPSMLRGEHELAIRFDFKPSVWQNGDTELWMGTIDTPPIRVEYR